MRGMTGRSFTDNACVVVECRLVQRPTLVGAIVTALRGNRSVVHLQLVPNIQAAIILDIPYFQVIARLGHRPLLADLTGGARILKNRRAV